MSISSSAMLVELNISVWTAAIVDRKATDTVTVAANAAADAGKFRKNLMAGTTLRKEIADYAALCRTWHNSRTLSWSDKGVRLLPTSMFFEYKQEADARAAYFNSKVEEFKTCYPQLLADAPNHLGALFNAADYPTVEEIDSKFGFRLVFSPVPEAGDFRVDVGNEELARLRVQYEDAYTERVNTAMQAAWDKLHSTLTHLSERLTEPEGEQTKQFRSTFLTNVEDMCSLLTHLNITNDPKLEQARKELERAITGLSIEDIRDYSGTRQSLKNEVDTVLSKFDW